MQLVYRWHWQSRLTPRTTVLTGKLTGPQLVKKFPTFYGTRSFITAFTSARHLSLSSSPCPQYNLLKIYFNIIHTLLLDLPNGLFPSGLPTKLLYAPLLSPILATCPAHLILLDLITRITFGSAYHKASRYVVVSSTLLCRSP
jgi:hypothetical protein